MIDPPVRREPSFERRSTARAGLRRLFGLPRSAARRIREQADKEELERLIAHLAALDGIEQAPTLGLMTRHPARNAFRPASPDALERLWALPARPRDGRSPAPRRH
jgi:hypothetical protein